MLRRSPSLTSWVLPTWLCQLTELVSWPGRTRRGSCRSRKYSTEVPQQAGTLADRQIRAWTLTCGGTRMETACLLFASRGSGVRVPLAAQGGLHVSVGPIFTFGSDILVRSLAWLWLLSCRVCSCLPGGFLRARERFPGVLALSACRCPGTGWGAVPACGRTGLG